MFFFFQQKTAYELLISDWSSDVCSSDLRSRTFAGAVPTQPAEGGGAVALSAAWRGTVGCHSSIGCSRDCCRGPHRLVRPAATGPRQARRSDLAASPARATPQSMVPQCRLATGSAPGGEKGVQHGKI